MEINFNVEPHSMNYFLEGKLEDGREFSVNLNWNDWDGYNLIPEEIDFHGQEVTEEELQEIVDFILNHYNN